MGRGPALIAIAVAGALLAVLGPAAPAAGEAASAASATAVGLSVRGPVPVPPVPAVTASQPPDSGEHRRVPVDLQVPPVAATATAAVVAEASREARLATAAFPELMDNALRRHTPEALANARAFTRTEGLGIGLGSHEDAVQGLLTDTLVAATAVETSAIARCVGDEALFDTDYRVVGLKVLGQDVGSEALLAPVIAGLGGPGVLSITQGEAGPLPGGGVFINGLRIVVPLLNVDIIVGRSEARMPTPCGAGAASTTAEVTAPPRPMAAGAAPAITATRLAATGARRRGLDGGVAMIGAGLGLRAVSRRWGRARHVATPSA